MHRSIVDAGYSVCAPFWDSLHGDRTDEVRFWADLAHPYGKRVLAPLAATGGIAAGLAAAGFEVTALDCCPEMTRIAAAKAESIPGLTCLRGTLPDLGDAREEYDFVFLAGGDYHHYDDEVGQLTVLESIHRLLRPGGGFGLEMMTFAPDRPEREAGCVRAAGASATDAMLVASEQQWSYSERMLRLDQRVRIERGEDSEECDFHIPLRMFTRIELLSSLSQVGFRRVAEYGSLDFAPHTLRSPQWFVLAERRSGC